MFAYFGAKHALADTYPRPRYPTIIEPFAGAAGYSTYWAHDHDVHLYDIDPHVVALWNRIITTDVDELERQVLAELAKDRTNDLIVASSGGGTAWHLTKRGTDRAITARMLKDTPKVLDRIRRTRQRPIRWHIHHQSWREIPDIEATWFIDPPYQPIISGAGRFYTYGADDIDYSQLADWCLSRRGQVIVCEQSPASWLPFTPHRYQGNGENNGGTRRLEVVWFNDQQQLCLI